MLRSIAELATYGVLAALLVAASVRPAEATPVAVTASTGGTERGRMLFATKGCVGCHAHVSITGRRMNVGPDLSALAETAKGRVRGLDAAAYVRQSLRDPEAYVVAGYEALMPDLKIADGDVEALVAFLLSPAR
jgi:cytochrome c oxidase subunit 2